MQQIAARSALIVVDLQQGTLANPLVVPAEVIVGRVVSLADAFRSTGRPVVLATASGMPRGHTQYGGPRALPDGWDTLTPELSPQSGDLRVSRVGWSVFADGDLDARLRGVGVEQVVVVGLATSFGVESSARAAYDLGYDVVLVTDAMTDLSLAAHDHSVASVFPALGVLATADEVLDRLRA